MPSYPVRYPITGDKEDGPFRWAIFSTVVDDFTHIDLSEDDTRSTLIEKGYSEDSISRAMATARQEIPPSTPFMEYCYMSECLRTVYEIHGFGRLAEVAAELAETIAKPGEENDDE